MTIDPHIELLRKMMEHDREHAAAQLEEFARRREASGDLTQAERDRAEAARVRAERFFWETEAA